MIAEAYVTYDTAKLLKEKGFDEPIKCWYDNFADFHEQGVKMNNTDCLPPTIMCPSHQMACAWLRERNIGIVPEIHITQDPKDYYWGACIFHLDKSWDILQYVTEPSKNVIDGYDGVIEQALKYSLENLL